MTDPIPPYIPGAQQINISKLVDEFASAGLAINPDSVGWQADQTLSYNWLVRPTSSMLQQAANIIAIHDPTADARENARISFEGATKIVRRTAFAHTSGSSAQVIGSINVPTTSAIYADMIVISSNTSNGAVKVFRVHGVVKRLNGDPVFVPSGSPGTHVSGSPFADSGLASRTFASEIDTANDRLNFVATPEGNVEIDWVIIVLGILVNP